MVKLIWIPWGGNDIADKLAKKDLNVHSQELNRPVASWKA
jgi:hypothetical protein